MNDTATQQGAAPSKQPVLDPDVDTSQEVEVNLSPRDIALASMADRQEEARRTEIDDAIASDPDVAAAQARIDNAIADSNAEAGITHENDVPSFGANDGAASREPMHTEQPAPQPDLPGNLSDDPLADFIEMHNGKPMVKAKVNGQDRLVPLADAKRQVQIGVAAEVRMQNAAQIEQTLNERERRLTAGEAALSARMQAVPPQPVTPAQQPADLSDDVLLEEATDIFNTAFSGSEEDAAKKLAGALVKIRDGAAVRQPTQQVDQRAIAREAASEVLGTLTAQSRSKDVQKGYTDFKTNYPDIMGDPQLYKMADDMTEQLERDNPDWTIAQVMDEAGKRTRTWVKGLRGETQDTGEPISDDLKDQNSLVPDHTTETRLERKSGLVRIPTSAGAAQHHEPEAASEDEQSPSEALAELRASRGQPV